MVSFVKSMANLLHSLVIPVFNEERVLPELLRRLQDTLGKPLRSRDENYELVFVDDGSRDRSRAILREFRQQDSNHVRLIFFSRNFGHQAAITAGMDFARGDTVTVLDADLQDPPEVVLEMIAKWREGHDVIYAVRERRIREGYFKRVTALLFYRLLRKSTRLEIPLDAGDFRLMSRKAIEAMKKLPERHRFIRGLTTWIGFQQTCVKYVRQPRAYGETKYPLSKMVQLAWDAFTGFSLMPLQLATYLGLFAATLSVLAGVWALYIRLFTERTVQGWTSLMIAVLFLGGVQLFAIGMLGEYVGRIFEESKRRPLYLVDEIFENEQNSRG